MAVAGTQGAARDLLRAGQARAAFEALKGEVRKAPRDAGLRIFLFQMFCVFGEWDRALNQLVVVEELDKLAIPMVTTYRAAIRCEVLRGRVFAGETLPAVFAEPEPWMPLLIEANRHTARGDHAAAATLRERALADAPAAAGVADGTAFEWIADADPRCGPMLEAILDGRYVWVPFHRLAGIVIEPPADLRDSIWLPTTLRFANGGENVALLPARYPGSESASDDAIALGRRTDWRDADGAQLGLGQRMLATDAADLPLLDVRSITFDAA